MTSPESSSVALPESLPQAIALSAGSPLRLSSPTIPLSQQEPTSIATSYLTSDRQKEDQMLAFLRNATPLDRASSLPPCVPLVVETGKYLAAAALENWEMLCAELECHRAVFKFCCTSRELLITLCSSPIAIEHDSSIIRFVAEYLWLCVPSLVSSTHQLYAEKFSQLMTILQELDRKSNVVRWSDAVSLGHDMSLMREVFAQQGGEEASLTTRGTVAENDNSTDAPIMSTAIDHENTANPVSGDDSPSPTTQYLLRRRPKKSTTHDCTAPLSRKTFGMIAFQILLDSLNTDDRYVNQRAEDDWTSMVDWEGFGHNRS